MNSYEKIYTLLTEQSEPAHWQTLTIKSRIKNLIRKSRIKLRRRKPLRRRVGHPSDELNSLARAEVKAGG